MSIESNVVAPAERSASPHVTRAEKSVGALVAVLVSSTLLGSMLSLFEARSVAAATARIAIPTQPTAGGLAARHALARPHG